MLHRTSRHTYRQPMRHRLALTVAHALVAPSECQPPAAYSQTLPGTLEPTRETRKRLDGHGGNA